MAVKRILPARVASAKTGATLPAAIEASALTRARRGGAGRAPTRVGSRGRRRRPPWSCRPPPGRRSCCWSRPLFTPGRQRETLAAAGPGWAPPDSRDAYTWGSVGYAWREELQASDDSTIISLRRREPGPTICPRGRLTTAIKVPNTCLASDLRGTIRFMEQNRGQPSLSFFGLCAADGVPWR